MVWTDQPSTGFEIGKLDKAASPAAEIMEKIKADIQSSEDSFGTDYSFRESRTFWSKAATLMLKAEVYLWSGRRMGGGSADATVAQNALTDIQSHISRDTLDLMPNFTMHNIQNETDLFGGSWRNNLVPQRATLSLYYDKETDGQFELNFNGNMYYPVRNELYDNFDNLDTRKQGTLKAVFTMDAPHDYVGCFPYKYRGTTPSGASERLFADDFPVYRNAD